jgi:hypothetical protein
VKKLITIILLLVAYSAHAQETDQKPSKVIQSWNVGVSIVPQGAIRLKHTDEEFRTFTNVQITTPIMLRGNVIVMPGYSMTNNGPGILVGKMLPGDIGVFTFHGTKTTDARNGISSLGLVRFTKMQGQVSVNLFTELGMTWLDQEPILFTGIFLTANVKK